MQTFMISLIYVPDSSDNELELFVGNIVIFPKSFRKTSVNIQTHACILGCRNGIQEIGI